MSANDTNQGVALATLVEGIGLQPAKPRWLETHGQRLVTAVTADSREVVPGALFVAISGSKENGERFIASAIELGASAVVAADGVPMQASDAIAFFSASDPRIALAKIAANFFGRPAQSLAVCAVTGTNGKTTSCWLLHQALTALNRSAMRLGTAGNYLAGVLDEESKLTTLDAVELQRLAALARHHNASYLVLEASSHALDQERLAAIPLSVAIFTNLTRDHLDYHRTYEAYEAAKRRIFDLLKPDGVGVINVDDPCGVRFADYCRSIGRRVVTFSRNDNTPNLVCDVKITKVTSSLAAGSAISLKVSGDLAPSGAVTTLTSPLLGEFNAENLVGVYCGLLALGFDPVAAGVALSKAPGSPGRLERFSHRGRTVFVDYAHTPDALERALEALRPLTSGRLGVVFGCGGDRDKGKRPLMGAIASRLADLVTLTSDNPRTEAPERILHDIAQGAGPAAKHRTDRAEAIAEAIAAMQVDDVLLVAGKGHENYQIFADKTVPFSDQLVVDESLKRAFD